jgi:hypothetical protein
VSDKTKGDWRDRRYSQVYRSDDQTLALCRGFYDERGQAPPGNLGVDFDYRSFARIRIVKQDTRLPMTVCIAFDPNEGNPDKASISARDIPSVTAAELVLLRRSYVPVKQVVGNMSLAGSIEVPARLGALGIALSFSSECDAVDILVSLFHAQGEYMGEIPELGPRYASGRWITGYSFTTNERLSIEEWQDAVSRTNMSIERFYKTSQTGDDDATDSLRLVTMPVLVSGVPG